MHRTLLICLACLTLVLNAAGQEKTQYQFADGLQREVTLLLDKDINDVTRQLNSEDPSSVNSLLRRLVIYERAGQTSRVSKTLEQLSSAENWQCPADHDFKLLIWVPEGPNVYSYRPAPGTALSGARCIRPAAKFGSAGAVINSGCAWL